MTQTAETCNREYDFTLVLTGVRKLGDRKLGDSELTDDLQNALLEAGCDDATPAVRSGRIFLTFSRTAPSLKQAILSAIEQVWNTKTGADVLRVDDCNLVTQADIGYRLRRSRQQIHQYVTGVRGPGGFPPPACSIADDSPLWYWCEVAYWLWENDLIKEDVLEDAEDVAAINNMLEMKHQKRRKPALFQELTKFLRSFRPVSARRIKPSRPARSR